METIDFNTVITENISVVEELFLMYRNLNLLRYCNFCSTRWK